MEKFKKFVIRNTKEFTDSISNNGYPVSVEFSTSKEKLELKKDIFNDINNSLLNDYMYEWDISYCETCKEYNEETPYHCEIKRKNQ